MMRKKLACAMMALLTLFMLSTAYAPAAGVVYATGAKAGTIANYSYEQTNFTAGYSVSIHVTSVSSTTITFEKDEYNYGGSLNNTHTLTYDVTNVASYSPIWFLPANLTTHDVLPGFTIWWINGTTSGYSIGGATWTANHMSGLVSGINVTAYWDKPTGLILKWSYRNSFGLSINLTLTSLGSPSAGLPSNLILIGGGAVVVIIVLAAVVLVRRRK